MANPRVKPFENTAAIQVALAKHKAKKSEHAGMGVVLYGCATCRTLEYAIRTRIAKGKP